MNARLKYEQLIPLIDRRVLEEVLQMGDGYVLDFSDRTFAEFFVELARIDPVADPTLFSGRGTSKAKRLRSFIELAPGHQVAKVLRGLWEYRKRTDATFEAEKYRQTYFEIVGRVEGSDSAIDASALEAFEPNETLEELVAAIVRDLDAKRPQAALDRLHTYCMKRFASLILKHRGEPCGKDDPLHSRVGMYVRILKSHPGLTPMSERIIKSSISVFEAMNEIRNNQSFAHDNPKILSMDEARFIFDSVTAFLRFSKAVDGRNFED